MVLARGAPRRIPRTVFFTDIVGSTEMAAEVGDKRWRRTVARHHAAIRRELRRHHGREVDTAGDGFFAVFESPTDAVRCASAVIAAVHGIGLRIRAGVHTGEVEPAGDKVGGIAVHIGARLLAMAEPEEVLVSSTVRELVAGSGHEFEDRGEHELRGVPGRWHVFALVLPRLDESIAVGAADDEEERHAASTRRQRLVIAGLVGVIAVLAAAVGGFTFLSSRPVPPATGPGSAVGFGPGQTQPLAGWSVGRGPEALVYADGVLWAANLDGGTVARVETASGEVATLGQVGPRPSAVLVAGQQVWVADRYNDVVSVLATDSGTLVKQLALHAAALAGDEGAVWVADDLADRLVRYDPRSLTEVDTISLPTPAGPTDLVALDAALWVAAPRASGLLRVDPASGEATVQPSDIAAITSIAAHGQDLWIASRSADIVARLEALTGRLAVRVDVCDTPVDLAPFEGGVWVACATERALWRLDSAGQVLDTFGLDGVPTAVAADGERVWVALRAD